MRITVEILQMFVSAHGSANEYISKHKEKIVKCFYVSVLLDINTLDKKGTIALISNS